MGGASYYNSYCRRFSHKLISFQVRSNQRRSNLFVSSSAYCFFLVVAFPIKCWKFRLTMEPA
ncbi:hypothetical protein BDV19DRAFT_369243 [Aspergillus venezuelensis]